MRTLVPPFILDRLNDDTPEGSLDAAVLLVDATGSTALATALQFAGTKGAEILASITWDVFAPQVDAVLEHGGFIAGFAGDGFVAVFPGDAAGSVPKAVATAHQIRRHMVTCSIHHHEFGESRFDVKSVIAHGEITWHIWHSAHVTSGQSHAYMISGDAIRQAQHGEASADAGTVLLTSEAARCTALGETSATDLPGFVRLHTSARSGETKDATTPTVNLTQHVSGSADRFFPASLSTTPLRGEFRSVVSAFIKLRETPDAGSGDSAIADILSMVALRGGFVCDINRPNATDRGCTVLTYWGAPTAFEDTLERAITFLLDARNMLGADQIRAGATVDTLFAGFVGSDLQAAYTCLGSGVNLAARLVSANNWGDLWVDEALADVLAPEVRVRSVGAKTLRGFGDEVIVTEVLGKGDVAGDRFFAGSFVGRERETAQLVEWLGDIRDGSSGAIVVTGEAGSGKSRLLHELHQQLGEDVRWLIGHTDPIGRAPLNPVAYMIKRGMDIDLEDHAATIRDKVDARLDAMRDVADDDLSRELAQARDPILSLIGVLDPDASFFGLLPQLQFERVVESIIAMLTFDSHHRFVVAFLEDAQWLDATTSEVLARVVDGTAHLPIAVVITNRIPFDQPWVGHSMELVPLDRDSISSYVATLLGDAPSEELVDLLVSRTDGNPYYVEQVVRFMQSDDLLIPGESGISPRNAGSRVPMNLQSVLIARIDRLANGSRLPSRARQCSGESSIYRFCCACLGHCFGSRGRRCRSQRDLDRHQRIAISLSSRPHP